MKLVNSFYAEFFLNSFTVFIVQLYFIHTIWKLLEDREMWLRRPSTIAALVLATLSFAGGCGAVYRANLNHLITGVLANVTVRQSRSTPRKVTNSSCAGPCINRNSLCRYYRHLYHHLSLLDLECGKDRLQTE